jgi:hypothetical protein
MRGVRGSSMLLLLGAVLVCLSCLRLCWAQGVATDLWLDGGFESGTLNSYEVLGVASGNVAIQPVNAGFVRTGAFDVNIFNVVGNLDSAATFGLSQTIPSVPSLSHLNLTFFLINPDGGAPASFSVFAAFDSSPAQEVFRIVNTTAFRFTAFNALITTPANPTNLTVSFLTYILGPTGFYLDDISLVVAGPITTPFTPQPPVPDAFPKDTTGFVLNGGFETGALDGWQVPNNNNDVEEVGIIFTTPPTAPCNTGLYCATIAPMDFTTGIYQAVTVPQSATYTLSFQLYNQGSIPNGANITFTASVQWDSDPAQTLLHLVNPPAFNYTLHSFTLTAPSGWDTSLLIINFFAFQIDNFFILDDVSLVTRSTVIGDPQFVGLQGQSYQVHGVHGTVYNLITAADLQVNAEFVFLQSGRCPIIDGVAARDCWSHPGSYLGAIGIQQKTSTGVDSVRLQSGNAEEGFASVVLNGLAMKLGQSYESADGSFSVNLTSSHQVDVETPTFRFSFSNSDGFINQQVATKQQMSSLNAHGLLGQTHRRVIYKSQLRYIEGEVDDYAIDNNDLFGTDFLYNQFTKQ